MDRERDVWNRRSTNSSKLSISMPKSDRENGKDSTMTTPRRFGSMSSTRNGSTNGGSLASPTSGGSTAFGLGSGAFASFGSATKPSKPSGMAFDFAPKAPASPSSTTTAERSKPTTRRSLSFLKSNNLASPTRETTTNGAGLNFDRSWPLKFSWIFWYRQPAPKNQDYAKSMKAMLKVSTVQEFWQVYNCLVRPSTLPIVSDYHFFKNGIRPIWEDDENKSGGKWMMRLKKGVADRYWEDLLLALIGDQFGEAGEDVCGAVVSIRSGEDVFSIWTKSEGGRNMKIRETVKRVLNLPADTNIVWKSHDDSITQRTAIDQARHDRLQSNDKRRNNHSDMTIQEQATGI